MKWTSCLNHTKIQNILSQTKVRKRNVGGPLRFVWTQVLIPAHDSLYIWNHNSFYYSGRLVSHFILPSIIMEAFNAENSYGSEL